MADRDHCPPESALVAPDHVTVVFHKVASHGENSGGDGENSGSDGGRWCGDGHPTKEGTHSRAWRYLDGDAEEDAAACKLPEGGERETLCPPPAARDTRKPASNDLSASQGSLDF